MPCRVVQSFLCSEGQSFLMRTQKPAWSMIKSLLHHGRSEALLLLQASIDPGLDGTSPSAPCVNLHCRLIRFLTPHSSAPLCHTGQLQYRLPERQQQAC
eukprot:1161864-Pelagomonas_calceolata.AAC.33